MLNKSFGRGKCLYTDHEKNDDVYTPRNVAKRIIDLYDIKGKVLDGFAGDGAFFDQYPENVEKDWCEIKKGKDFFEYTDYVDWIITNPPYSIFDEILEHSYKIADNIVYLIPLSKLFSSMGRIRKVFNYGNIVSIHILAACKCGFSFGFPCCAVYIKRNYKGDTKICELNI